MYTQRRKYAKTERAETAGFGFRAVFSVQTQQTQTGLPDMEVSMHGAPKNKNEMSDRMT